jgi:endonuclease/exonuclease/phosphatase family metal-dependent hydrolase
MLDKKDAPAAVQSATVSLRVGTFNIQNGGGVGHDFSVLAQDILDQGLDVVGLQEVDMFTSRNKGQDTMKALSEATGYKYYGYTKCINLSGVAGVNGGVGEYGTGILSKYPIISYEAVLLPRVSGEQRGYGHAVIEVDGLQFDFYNTHLDWPNKADRTEQFKVFKAIMDADQSAIIVGDLNTEDPAEYRAPFPYCTFANGLKGDPNYYITNHEDGAIDNIIASTNVTIKKTTLVDTTSNRHTDHNMLWADVEITREDAFREENGAVRLYKNGAYLTGWQVYGKSIFYFDPETGAMQKNDLTVDGETYQFEKSTFYGMDLYSLSGDSMPPKNLLPQEWITGLLSGMGPADKELTYAAAHNTRYTADGKEHTPSAFALSLNKFYLQYQFDSEEIDATDYGYTFEIWYKDADKDSEYKFVTLKAERSLKLSNGNILYRLPVYDYGMTDLVTNNNGRTNTYDTVIVIYDGNGAIAGFKQIAIDFTDSSALFLADAISE